MSRSLKEFIKLYGPLALGILIAAAWFLHTRNQDYREIVGERQKTLVSIKSDIIMRELESHAADARFLARTMHRRLALAPKNEAIQDQAELFTDFSRSHLFYFQIRYIDTTGMEQIRIEQSPAGLVVAPSNSLQSKADRYYFTETMKAGENEVYISGFDLNIEHGQLEIPYRPTLRVACPVIDNSGVRQGLVILNIDGNALLNELKAQDLEHYGIPMFCDSQGYWMLGPTPEDEWGQILPERKMISMQHFFPAIWSSMLEAEKGQITTPNGLFTFDTIRITPNSILTEATASPEDFKLRWRILTQVPSDQLNVPWMNLFIVLVILFLIVLSAGCWHLAESRIHQVEIEEELRDSEERTLAISQSAQDAIVMIDEHGKVTYWNPAAIRLFGYSVSEILGQNLHERLAPESEHEAARLGMQEFAITGRGNAIGHTLEFDAPRKDGSTVPIELATSSFQLKGHWYAVGSIRDRTRRKQYESQLRRGEETNRALINATSESAMLIESTGTIIAINTIGARWLESTVEALIQKNALELMPLENHEDFRATIMSVLQTGRSASIEDTQGYRRVLFNIHPVKDQDGSVERLAIFGRNVTEQRRAEAALRASEQRFRDVSEAVGEFIWETDAAGRLKFITEDVTMVLGYSARELEGNPLFHCMPDADREGIADWLSSVYEKQLPFANVELRNTTKDGQTIWIQISGVPYSDDNGEFMGYRGAAMNITDKKTSEEAIKESEEKLRALAESAYDAIVMTDNQGRVSFWNQAAEDLFGYTEAEILGKEVHALIAPPEELEKVKQGLHKFAITGTGPVIGGVIEATGTHKDGHSIPIERSTSSFKLGKQWYAVATIRDISERKAIEARLTELATTDSLTALNNRRRFMELSESEFARCLRYKRPLAMFMIDIDHFKNVNDTYGHDIGDVVLKNLSKTALIALRKADILGRLGGEEFGALLPETSKDAAMEVAERLRQAVERNTIPTTAGDLKITISIGVAFMKPETKSIAELLKRADIALYEAKDSGRNKVVAG